MMETKSKQLDFLLNFKKNNSLEFKKGIMSGEISVARPLKDLLLEFQNKCLFATLEISRVEGNNLLEDVENDETIDLSIELDRGRGTVIAQNLDDLLTTSGNKYGREIPDLVVLIDENWRSWDESSYNKSVSAYIEAIKFFKFLRNDVSDHSDIRKCHFFGTKEKVSLTLGFSANAIELHADEIIKSIASLSSIMNEELYKEDKVRQLKLVLIDLLKNKEEKTRADSLLINIADLTRRFIHNYELFISGFSFENEKEELVKKNREYTHALNNVINSIHTRVIGIPLGTVLPALMIKSENFLMSELNIIIFMSSVFIMLVISFSLRSQWVLLQKIRAEYTVKWARMKSDIPNLMGELQEEFNHLESCFKLNRNLIISFWLALYLFFLVPVSVFFDIYFGDMGYISVIIKSVFAICVSFLSLVSK